MILLSESFLSKEFNPLKKYYSLADLRKAISKINISGISLGNLGYKYGKLIKVRMVSKVAGRVVVYVVEQKGVVVPIVIRLKKDKIFGENLSLNNKKGEALILYMLKSVMDDIRVGKYQKIAN